MEEEAPNALDLLEELLALIDTNKLNSFERDEYSRIAAQAADLRDGTDV